MTQLPAVLALNGPPHSGKSHIGKMLKRLIPDAVMLYPIRLAFQLMQEEGAVPREMLYDDFKLQPRSRERLIEKSAELRARDPEFYERKIVGLDEYRNARVVIIDNVGHTSTEHLFYERHSSVLLLLRIDTPYQELEPMKSRARRLKATWEGDSRHPVEHHTMLTAYDSRQMQLLLDWLDRPLTREEAGPYYGIKSLWNQYFTYRESAGDLFANGGTPRFMGGLGETAHAAGSHR
jgi:hypothetical protein